MMVDEYSTVLEAVIEDIMNDYYRGDWRDGSVLWSMEQIYYEYWLWNIIYSSGIIDRALERE